MKHKFINFILISSILLFIGCENSVTNNDTGTLSVKLMDAPFPINLVSEANVTITKIEVRKAQSESDGNPFLILSEEEFSYNLLDLQNGLIADLVDIDVPVGDYDLVRLYVDSASIKLKDETVYYLTVPSGYETGIKIFIEPPITVVGGVTTELVLDFDVSQSYVVQGDPYTPAGISGFIFTPVIRAANVSTTGSIEGYVLDSDSDKLEGANVWIDHNGDTYSTSTSGNPDKGYFMLAHIPVGTYTVNATKMTADVEYDTVSVENVQVVAGNVIQVTDIVLTEQ